MQRPAIGFFIENIENMAMTFGQGGGGGGGGVGFILNVRLSIVAQKSICESSLRSRFVSKSWLCLNS